MTSVARISGAAALGAAMLIGCFVAAPPARAAYTVTLKQQGNDVVASGSGTLDTAGLSGPFGITAATGTIPNLAYILTGPQGGGSIDTYAGVAGPTSFGSGGGTPASSGSGNLVGIEGSSNALFVPAGYVSGNPLSDTSIYDDQSFTTLGVTPGTYVWNWGSAATADSFSLDIGTPAVPEPAGLLLLALPLGLVVLAMRPRRAALVARSA